MNDRTDPSPTGRLGGRGPSIQNATVRTARGGEIRDAFTGARLPTGAERAALAVAARGTVHDWPYEIRDEEIRECRRRGWLFTWHSVVTSAGGGAVGGRNKDEITALGLRALHAYSTPASGPSSLAEGS